MKRLQIVLEGAARRTFSALAIPRSRRGLVLALVGATAFAIVSRARPLGAEPVPAKRPNIVLIVTDDLGWGDLACHGNPVVATPNIDAMLERGGELTRFYVSPVCSPTRASLMTGRYNYRTRVTDTFRGNSMMEPSERTIAELLCEAGYATGIFGKWHLGDCYPLRPQDQGFQVAVVLRGGGLGQPSDPLESRGRYTNPTLWRNGNAFAAEGYCTDVFFDEAMQFAARCAKADSPFFIYLATNAPHGPFDDVPAALYRKYKAADLSRVVAGDDSQADKVARIFAMIENIDENVGRLRERLADLGIAENTLLVFMSDNGPEGARYVGDRRGTKGQVLEGGIISPFIVEWPGRVPPGLRNDRIAAHIDVLPTLLAAAGVEVPADAPIDGRNLVPLLTGRASDWPDRTLVIQSHRGNQPVARHNLAVVEQRWKLIRDSGFGNLKPAEDVPYRLYDLAQDPGESKDLGREEPEVVARLRRHYDDWFLDVSTTRPNNFAPPRIVVGTDHEPVTTLTRQDWQARGPGWGNQGRWLLRAESPGKFDVEILLEQPQAGTATLSLGRSHHTQRLANPASKIVFSDVPLQPGHTNVRFELKEGAIREAPYQIRLIKK